MTSPSYSSIWWWKWIVWKSNLREWYVCKDSIVLVYNMVSGRRSDRLIIHNWSTASISGLGEIPIIIHAQLVSRYWILFFTLMKCGKKSTVTSKLVFCWLFYVNEKLFSSQNFEVKQSLFPWNNFLLVVGCIWTTIFLRRKNFKMLPCQSQF